jgi:16S rRNA (guanine966-N2)-methyltransferase
MTILSPESDSTRPVTDRVKQSIFDVLYKYHLIEDRFVADLFCGTGSFGLEVLSRGAKEAVFVDVNRPVLEILKKNIAKAGFIEQSRVVRSDAFQVGAPAGGGEDKFSLVFVDPPYAMSRDTGPGSRLGELLELLAGQIADDGLVIVRIEEHTRVLDSYAALKIVDRRQWGSMNVAFLQK